MKIEIPDEWQQLDPAALRGAVMILGGCDTGKSTLARHLFMQVAAHRRAAFLDCDVGQSTLGMPTTLNLAMAFAITPPAFPPLGERVAYFVGSTTPRHHLLQTIVGAHKLVQRAYAAGAEVVIVDTSGFIDPTTGGGALKQWKIELLAPTTLIGLARGDELEHILRPWRNMRSMTLYEFAPAAQAQPRTRDQRKAYRRAKWHDYFAQARNVLIDLSNYAVFDADFVEYGDVCAFQDEDGFVVELGIAREYRPREAKLVARTPLSSLQRVHSVRFGDWQVNGK